MLSNDRLAPTAPTWDDAISLVACEPQVRARLIAWYRDLMAVGHEINDQDTVTRAATRIADLEGGQP